MPHHCARRNRDSRYERQTHQNPALRRHLGRHRRIGRDSSRRGLHGQSHSRRHYQNHEALLNQVVLGTNQSRRRRASPAKHEIPLPRSNARTAGKSTTGGFSKALRFFCAPGTFLLDMPSLTHFIYFNQMKNTAGNKTKSAPSPTRDETAQRHGHLNNETKPTLNGTKTEK